MKAIGWYLDSYPGTFMKCPKQACCWALSSCCFHCLLLQHHLSADSIWTWLQRHDLVWLLFILQVGSFWFILPNHSRIYSCMFSQYFHKEYFSLILASASLLGNSSETNMFEKAIFPQCLWPEIQSHGGGSAVRFKCITFLSQFDSIHMESSKVQVILADLSGTQFMVHLSFFW